MRSIVKLASMTPMISDMKNRSKNDKARPSSTRTSSNSIIAAMLLRRAVAITVSVIAEKSNQSAK